MHDLQVLFGQRAAPMMPGPSCGVPADDRDALKPLVAERLRAYGEQLAESGAAQKGAAFTDDEAADAFIKGSPEAFLIGVLFTQGIPAERAWAGPYLLASRLGHFDLKRMAKERDRIAEAVAAPPALHRFVRTIPKWISSAACQLIDRYEGSATAIWQEGTPLPVVVERLRSFDGIGPKKAMMAVGILTRHFGVRLASVKSGSVAYDVHVRRVFLRCGLVSEDSAEAVAVAAKEACPEAPGTLDLATWLVGREYCRPTGPRCDECVLGAVCPRLTERSVAGVGTRTGAGPLTA